MLFNMKNKLVEIDRMGPSDVIRAKRDIEEYLRENGVSSLYVETKDIINSYGIYVNWSVKDISIHGPSSNDWRRAIESEHNNHDFININNTFNSTSNGVWIGGFKSFTDAYTFADLLRRRLYLLTHEDSKIFGSKGIKNIPERLF